MELLPTDLEIQKAIFDLGPHKSAGPDCFNAFIIQKHWDLFGPPILKEIHNFFHTGELPSDIAKSNLVLIPKGNEPKQVGDYRPISVCNVVYKAISKILTSRLKPYVAGCISSSQSAFVPGREISENVIFYVRYCILLTQLLTLTRIFVSRLIYPRLSTEWTGTI